MTLQTNRTPPWPWQSLGDAAAKVVERARLIREGVLDQDGAPVEEEEQSE